MDAGSAKNALVSQLGTHGAEARLLEKALEATEISLVVGELSLLQRKILNVLLEHAKPNLMKEEVHRIPLRHIINTLDYNSNDYGPIRSALDGLPSSRVRWDYLDRSETIRNKKDYGVSAFISQVVFKGDMVEYAYPPFVREMLHSPRRFAVIDLRIQSEFTRSYSLPLYEILKQHVERGETEFYAVKQWRELLGVPSGTIYSEFKHFRSKVLRPAITEVNAASDIVVEPRFRRNGRNISHVSFAVSANPQLPLGLTVHPLQVSLISRMTALGFREDQAEAALRAYDSDYIHQNLIVVEGRQAAGKIKDNAAGYLAKALEKDYRPVQTAKEKQERADARERTERLHRQAVQEQMRAEFSATRIASIKAALVNLSDDKRVHFEEDFAEDLNAVSNKIVLQMFRKSGLKSAMVRAAFYEFVAPTLGFANTRALQEQFLRDRGVDPQEFPR